VHAAQRDEIILKLIRDKGFISFKELDLKVKASPATLRRDLGRLENEGSIIRVRGGAKAIVEVQGTPPSHLQGVPFHENIVRNRNAKSAIGEAAAKLCKAGEAIVIDGGSTTLQMCPHLEDLGLQVLTNSLHIVSALLPQPRTRISVPAGTVFREQNIVLSPFEDDGTSSYRASKMFLGAASVGRHGIMQTDVLLLQAERRLFERAEELILMVDSTNFDAAAGHVVCPLEEIDVVVTDRGIGAEHRRLLHAAGVRLIIADATPD